jgi:hypothetical protein
MVMGMIEPKEITLKTAAGAEKSYIISKFPAIAGREIVTKYPVSNVPKIGDYQQSEEVMLKLLAFTAVVQPDGSPLALSTRALVDNHVPDWETLARLEWAQLEYNVSFFGNGLNSDFFESISLKAVQWISETLIPLLGASLPTGKPPSTS